MMAVPQVLSAFAVMFPLLAGPALAGSIADIEHVVLFMQGTKYINLAPHGSLILLRESSIRPLLRNYGRSSWIL
jgi:hypothetical protein